MEEQAQSGAKKCPFFGQGKEKRREEAHNSTHPPTHTLSPSHLHDVGVAHLAADARLKHYHTLALLAPAHVRRQHHDLDRDLQPAPLPTEALPKLRSGGEQ